MGGSVNKSAQDAEQQNQIKAQQYAAQQQQAALAGVNSWTAANKPPGQAAAPLQAPQQQSPATIGGGVASGGQMPQHAQQPQQPQPMQGQPMPGQPPAPQPGAAAAAQRQAPTMTPAQRAQIMAQLQAQQSRPM